MKNQIVILLLFLLPFAAWGQSDDHRHHHRVLSVSSDIMLLQLSENAYQHMSIMEVDGYGKVAANGLIWVDCGEALLIDTPWTNEQTKTLVEWIEEHLRVPVTRFIATHWHGDCMGGLEYLQEKGIDSYANQMTIDIAREKGLPVPQHGFKRGLKMMSGRVDCYYPGAGHAMDNIVVWIPSEELLFGGCLVKDWAAANLGNVADGDAEAWPKTLQKVEKKFPNARVVVPGHGASGDMGLLARTRELLEEYSKE